MVIEISLYYDAWSKKKKYIKVFTGQSTNLLYLLFWFEENKTRVCQHEP